MTELPPEESFVDTALAESTEVREFFGSSYDQVARFASRLAAEGELRGLIGPRELPRLWERHIVNSAAVVPFIDDGASIADVGSGAGLPGLVIAMMRPASSVVLIEPMERRCEWLSEMAAELQLSNVEIRRGRAEEFHDAFEVQFVTARAVAALDKLCRMCLPLVARGGQMVVLKGQNVDREVPGALKVTRKLRAEAPEVLDAQTVAGVETTKVVRIRRP
ncbi:16S rRNA (guanine(527)-N(7))-methyltransferase RsmG [Cellulomonas sp. PhB143]|uniref:16S rRNA (guanine(527)-N(7))-methyltransferase RsmG n=1 Tax=Cellulomonas sp. PhB143 TaxID=2485186 RepID=UPI000F462B34|nr:16S rRNA (guanine(527)-N(7))-methyltransferase RsmG [Cellulomonas sp. PhB143]ROS75541.1 16S rRNA m(7)G-527 methyltransferase [Cellulomonas sp. PhB143]